MFLASISFLLSSCSNIIMTNTSVEYSEYELWRAVASCKSFAMVDQALEHGADIDSYSYRRFAENDGTIAVYYSPAWGQVSVEITRCWSTFFKKVQM